jgi:membrane associated rhomboid family serine protease
MAADLRAWPAFAAAALILATLAIFFAWTYPANQATENWTIMPETWETLRRQWEYSHAVNAVLTFAALCFVAGEAAGRGRKEGGPGDEIA